MGKWQEKENKQFEGERGKRKQRSEEGSDVEKKVDMEMKGRVKNNCLSLCLSSAALTDLL